MSKKKLIKRLRAMAVEPSYTDDWDGVAGTFNIERLADFILRQGAKL